MLFPKHGSSLIMGPRNLTKPYSLTCFLILLKDDLNLSLWNSLEEEFMPKKHLALPRCRRKKVVLTKTPRKELISSIFFPAQESQECGMRSSFNYKLLVQLLHRETLHQEPNFLSINSKGYETSLLT